ncbi:putative beta-glucosidase G [Colletotrichum sp. SAR 10_96]|nr:putative beta-glucosidase G [Colletotrichum sp. SAR 10_96]
MQDGPNGINIADLVSVFPAGLTTAASWDKGLMLERAKAIGEEFRGKGINIALGPSSGPLGRHALGGRNWEGFSVDPYLSGVAMEQTVLGIQSMGVQTCSKHFLANEQELQRTYTIVDGKRVEGISSNVGDRAIRELYAWPFYNAIKAGTTSIMCSYNRVNGTYVCENEYLLKNVLRDEMGFDGYVISDWFATHSGAKSINAGLDLNMPGAYDESTIQTGQSYWGPANITAMIDEGLVEEARIDEMVRRILTGYYYMDQDTSEHPETDWSLMYTFAAWSNVLDLFPPPYPESRDVREQHGDIIRKIAAESTVLLKNEGILPLKSPRNIGVFGNDAADPTDGLTFNRQFEIGTLDVGSGAASGRHTYLVSPLEAIKARAKETGSRVQYMLRNSIIAQGDFSALYPIPDETGNSIVDVLWGEVSPSGKLPYSIPFNSSDIDIPIVNLTNATSPDAWQSDFEEGLLVDYRHLDANEIEPRYAFGFGLSYTTFEMSSEVDVVQVAKNLTAEPDPSKSVVPGGHPDLWHSVMTIKTTVTNTGLITGGVVPQLYVSLPASTSPPGTPVQVLRGFEKLVLAAGESGDVLFELTRRDVSYYDELRRTWVIPEGVVKFHVGFSSRDIKATLEHVFFSGIMS